MDTECYCTSLRVAARRISAVYDAALAPVGINVAQWGLIRRIPAAGSGSVTIQELADLVELERSTVARNVRVLEKQGLIEMGVSATDRRSATLELAPAGERVLREGAPLWEGAQRQIESGLGKEPAAQLRELALSL